MKKVELLSKGLFQTKLMDSRIKTKAVTTKELILGHLIGPLGLIFIINTIAALVEKFFTQQYSLFALQAFGTLHGGLVDRFVAGMGSKYELVMTIVKFIGVAVGLFNGWLIQNTKSKQGRLRPWLLIIGFGSIIVGALIFLFPGTTLGNNYWTYFFLMLAVYHTVGVTFFNMYRDTIASLISRDPAEKYKLSFARKACWTLISGILIGLIVSNMLIPMWLEQDIVGYPVLMIILSVTAIPLLLIEYYYTRERVTESVSLESKEGESNKVPLKHQVKAIFTNRYLVIMFALLIITSIIDNFKGGNVQYFYVKYLLDGEHNGMMYMLYSIITGLPMGIGALLIYPVAKKIGIKNTAWIGYIMVLGGSVLGWIFANNLYVAMAAGFFREMGMLPNAYIFITLLYYAYDDAEFRSGVRLEGLLGIAIVFAIQNLMSAPFAGGYEASLAQMHFKDIDIPGMANLSITSGVKAFMSGAFYLTSIIMASVHLILLPFVNVEKRNNRIKIELTEREKTAFESRGEVWLNPEERAKKEAEEAAVETAQNRIADLKVYCEKNGLDFEIENAKYLAKKAEADKKKAAKDAVWLKKQEQKKQQGEAKIAAKEEKRITALKKKCEKYGLNFEEENQKYSDKLAAAKATQDAEMEAWYQKSMAQYNNFRAKMSADIAERREKSTGK